MRKIHQTRRDLILDVLRYYDRNRSEQRYGQAFFNYIAATYPEAAETIRGTHYDPFYMNYVDMETWAKIFEAVDLTE